MLCHSEYAYAFMFLLFFFLIYKHLCADTRLSEIPPLLLVSVVPLFQRQPVFQDETSSTHPTQTNSYLLCTNVKTQTQSGSPKTGSEEAQSNWYLTNIAACLFC